MHAPYPRLNQLSTHIMAMLAVLIILGSAASYLQVVDAKPKSSLSLASTPTLRRLTSEKCDQAMVRFNLEGDFDRLWTWNTKHIFLYVVATYESKTHTRNEVVIWDTILNSREEARTVDKKEAWNKYSLKDHGYGLKGAIVDLSLRWSLMPYMGVLTYGKAGGEKFQLPESYSGVKSSY